MVTEGRHFKFTPFLRHINANIALGYITRYEKQGIITTENTFDT